MHHLKNKIHERWTKEIADRQAKQQQDADLYGEKWKGTLGYLLEDLSIAFLSLRLSIFESLTRYTDYTKL